jgi:tetratricopeptide (TPR) repeat protein
MAAVVYSNTLGFKFVFDDFLGILDNPHISRCANLAQALRLLKEPWRAVTQSSYALTILLAGPNPRVFHAINVAIHICNSLLVFGIARLVARRWISTERPEAFALAAALIHAVHPLYTEAVAYVWGRSSSLCAFFYFGSLFLTMLGCRDHGRKRYLWYGLAAAAGILAWKTKEEAITLPFVIAGFFALVGSWRAAAAVMLIPPGMLGCRWRDIVSLYAKVKQNQPMISAGANPTLDPLVYFATQVKASVFYYLKKFAFPLNQSADPYVKPVTRLSDPLLWGSVIVLILLAALCVRMFKKQPALSFGILALLVSPLIAYALMPLADVVAEHRVYISGLGFDLLGAWILSRYPRYSYAALAGMTLTLGLLTLHRNRVWANSLSLWEDAESKSPGLARPHLNLGFAYQTAGRFDEALVEYRHALSVNPRLALAYVNMGVVYSSRNELDNAESALKRAAELSPSLSEPLVDLAVIALRRNQPAEALALMEKAVSLDDSYLVHLNKGDVLSRLGRYEDAVRDYKRALELRPDLPQLRQQIDIRLQHLRKMGALPAQDNVSRK